MSTRPLLLDLYCCQGGASEGYARAGWLVMGVDIEPQPRYPFPFVQDDALRYLKALLKFGNPFDAFHASPPCQLDSDTQRIQGNEHPDLIEPTRNLLELLDRPYVIENVRGAVPKLREPKMLCGAMFGMRTYRHRYFETNWPLWTPEHPAHLAPQAKMGRPPKEDEFGQYIGNYSGVLRSREDMQMPWANRDGIREAVPPQYTEYIGRQLMAGVMGQERAA